MVTVRDINGEASGEIDLPVQFTERIRPDIVKKAVHAAQANRRQPYGADPRAGLKHVTYWKKRSRAYRGTRGRSYPSSRTPRKITFRRGMQMSGPGGKAPNAVGGHRAHPPKAEKDWSKDINDKERRKAIRSAMSASMDAETVAARGHRIDDVELPLVVTDAIESMSKTSELEQLLVALGLQEELARVSEPQERSGKGTMRGRRYRRKVGPLIVIGEDNGIRAAGSNIPGVDVVSVRELNAELLAPGTDPGRLTIWTQSALNQLDEEGMFR